MCVLFGATKTSYIKEFSIKYENKFTQIGRACFQNHSKSQNPTVFCVEDVLKRFIITIGINYRINNAIWPHTPQGKKYFLEKQIPKIRIKDKKIENTEK